MPRVALDLNTDEGRGLVNGQWKVAEGYVPGEPNEGLQSQVLSSPARLADYDDSGWRVCENVRESLSVGFTFAWYRISVVVPDSVGGVSTQGARVFFETNIDNYGEVWVDGEVNRSTGAIVGLNASTGWKLTRTHLRGTGTSSRSWCSTAPWGASWRHFHALRHVGV